MYIYYMHTSNGLCNEMSTEFYLNGNYLKKLDKDIHT